MNRQCCIYVVADSRCVFRHSWYPLDAEPEGCRSNYWLQTLLLDESVADQRDTLLQATNDAGLDPAGMEPDALPEAVSELPPCALACRRVA